MARKSRIKVDRFQNPYQTVACKANKNGYPVGYVELGNKLYKLEPGESKTEGVESWVKVTQLDKKQRPTSM